MNSEQKTVTENATIKDLIAKLDVSAVGIASLAEGKGTKLEETALRLLPQARSVVVLAMEIAQEVLDLGSTERITGAASLNDLVTSDANYLYGRLTKAAYDIARTSRSLGLKALPLPAQGCPQDRRFLEAVFSYKHAGQAAGLGKIGWHSLLIAPELGPRVRLSACLTEAELEPTHTTMTVECESCGICLNNCPAGALAEPQAGEQYTINKFACSSFVNASGSCNQCMRVCPEGR
jgi:epoxyqueuosine reductase QueG